mgnify:FL=1
MDPPAQAPACGMHRADAGAAGRCEPAVEHQLCPVSLPGHYPPAAGRTAGRHDPQGALATDRRADSLPVLPAAALGRTAGHCAVPDRRHRAAGCHRAGRHPAAAAGTGALDRAFGARAVALFAQAAAAVRRGRQRRFLPH